MREGKGRGGFQAKKTPLGKTVPMDDLLVESPRKGKTGGGLGGIRFGKSEGKGGRIGKREAIAAPDLTSEEREGGLGDICSIKMGLETDRED